MFNYLGNKRLNIEGAGKITHDETLSLCRKSLLYQTNMINDKVLFLVKVFEAFQWLCFSDTFCAQPSYGNKLIK